MLHEPAEGYAPVPISERLVQAIWYDQRLTRDTLQTIDGRRVRVVSPGWWNLEAGPDFRRAVIAFDDGWPQLGDVEVHLRTPDWRQHGHNRDQLYDDVILHVALWPNVGAAPATAVHRALPQLVMVDQLDAPLEELHDSIDPENYPYKLDSHVGRCQEQLKLLAPETTRALLGEAGLERFRLKARRLSRWIQREGIEQALYASLMEALGYKQNKEPMRRLAERLPVARLRQLPVMEAQALLFGVAGFLPERTVTGQDAETRRQVKQLWDIWWKQRDEFAEKTISIDAWHLAGLRPANFPWRRLAAVSQLLARQWELWPTIQQILETSANGSSARQLESLFTDLEDTYWSTRYSFLSKVQPRAELLIGRGRARDIVVNVLLPSALAQGWLLEHPALIARAEQLFASYPKSESNAIDRFTAYRLFGQHVPPKLIASAARQQGLLQIFHDFCLSDRSGCERCQFSELVRQFGGKKGPSVRSALKSEMPEVSE